MREGLPSARAGGPLVGRIAELRVLGGHLEATAAGAGRVVLLCGEPGIGKSSLARVVGERARASGASVAWGRCRETEGAPAFWPWTQLLRTVLTRFGRPPPGGLRLLLKPGAHAPDGEDRFALFDAVGELLLELAAAQPLKRHATPAEIAAAVVYLASDESSFVTRTTLAVDGGLAG